MGNHHSTNRKAGYEDESKNESKAEDKPKDVDNLGKKVDKSIEELNHHNGDSSKEDLKGLSTQQAEELYQKYGYNEIHEEKTRIYMIFLNQFAGIMPYTLEITALIAIGIQSYPEFAIIVAIILANAILGFREQLNARKSLEHLTQQMEHKIATIRDGKAQPLSMKLLVPGDVVLLIAGTSVPADIEFIEGDVLKIDTAPLTGEPIPRKYPSKEYGKLILAGTTVRSGEAYGIVRKTGVHTEIGSASHDVFKDKSKKKVSVFQKRVLLVVQIIILVNAINVLVILLVQGLLQEKFSSSSSVQTLLTICVSILVASVPVALPIVLQVTMALGAGKMARKYNAVVTSLPALQDISSMTTLCSDKTGTLTTAKISIHAESVWVNPNQKFSQLDVALYAALASSRDKQDDAIDRSVIQHFDKLFSDEGMKLKSSYTKIRNTGFNSIYKRVVFEFQHPEKGHVIVAKGLPNKVLNTTDGGKDDAPDQWICKDYDSISEAMKQADLDFSKAGYKTLGVAMRMNAEPWEFVGILPMLDPPRHDTAATIKKLKDAGVAVKMITGDHPNIAKEIARLIGMGTNIHPFDDTRDDHINEDAKNKIIKEADGFAQVLPRDKREIVNVLRHTYYEVVGMTGDGVNDAAALAAAQCGIAVDDATDAAKNAAAIILTTPGLSAVYSAVVESRRIFRKLKSYVTYRLAASIQIILILSLFIYISNCSINPLLIILIALFNDITLLPIAYDHQQASALPDNPNVKEILAVSATLGLIQTAFVMLFAHVSGISNIFMRDYTINNTCTVEAQGANWLVLFLLTEFLIFSTRAPTYVFFSIPPSLVLIASIVLGCIIASILVGFVEGFGKIPGVDIVIIWVYCIIVFFVVDAIKVQILRFYGKSSDVLPEKHEMVSVPNQLLSSPSHQHPPLAIDPNQQSRGYVGVKSKKEDEGGAMNLNRSSRHDIEMGPVSEIHVHSSTEDYIHAGRALSHRHHSAMTRLHHMMSEKSDAERNRASLSQHSHRDKDARSGVDVDEKNKIGERGDAIVKPNQLIRDEQELGDNN